MTYVEQLRAEHAARLKRLSQRSPHALPPRVKPPVRIVIPFHLRPRPLTYPPLPPNLRRPQPPSILRSDRITVAEVMYATACAFDLSVQEAALKTTRHVRVMEPRQVAMYVSYTMIAGISLKMIGARMGGIDHTTVLHAKNVIPTKMQNNPELAAKVMTIQRQLQQLAKAAAP